ncbi:MAG: ATP-binding protein, partial [Candidatus Omnitrophota bacterium]
MISEPAVGKVFFGRDDILHVLEKRVNALLSGYRQNVALTGQMLSGKSSILYQFLYTLKNTSLIPIYIEVIEEPFPSFADKFIATILHNYLLSSGHEAPKDLLNLIKVAEQFIPHTIYAIKKVKAELSRKSYNDAYRKLLNLTSILKEETGKSCVVILDEFHNLEFFKIKKPYLCFGKIMMIQKDTMYIVSSSQKNAIKKILSEKLALLYGNFELIEVSGFDNKTAQAFIKEKFQNIALPQKYMGYLIDFTDGNPFYLDVISKKITELANSRRLTSVDENIIIEAFTSLIYNTSGTINQYFTNNIMNLLEKNLREVYLELLIALSLGCNKLKEIAGWFNKKTGSGFAGKLARLVELDMIYKNGVFYEVQDKVFKFWLKTVYHKKKTSLVDDIVNRANDFRKETRL